MERARRHQTFLARLALALLVLVAELVGRSLTHRVNIGRHVETPSYSGAEYYPFLLVAVKVGVALLLARTAWRFFDHSSCELPRLRWQSRCRSRSA